MDSYRWITFLGASSTTFRAVDTTATPVCQLRARVLIVNVEPADVCLLEEFLRDTATELRTVTDAQQVAQLFIELAADFKALERDLSRRSGWSEGRP
jgi:hypothetical protein